MLFLLSFIACLAFFVKALSGFGPAMIFIGLANFFMSAHELVITSSILDLIGSLLLFKADWQSGKLKFLIPLMIAMFLGALLGSLALPFIPVEILRLSLITIICLLGIWFSTGKFNNNPQELKSAIPDQANLTQILVSFISGVIGGITGMSGPLMIWYFGRNFQKRSFRQILVLIFIAASLTRTITFSVMGLVSTEIITYVFYALPGLVLGLYLGNKLHFSISENTFRKVIGLVLLLAGIISFLR